MHVRRQLPEVAHSIVAFRLLSELSTRACHAFVDMFDAAANCLLDDTHSYRYFASLFVCYQQDEHVCSKSARR
jgi:hypothetical protein